MITFEKFAQVVCEVVGTATESSFEGVYTTATGYDAALRYLYAGVKDSSVKYIGRQDTLCGDMVSVSSDTSAGQVSLDFPTLARVIEKVCGRVSLNTYNKIIILAKVGTNTIVYNSGVASKDVSFRYHYVNLGKFYYALVKTETEWSK